MPRLEAASISITSGCRSARMATHSGQTPQGSAVGRPCRPADAVQRAGDDAGGGGLAHAAHAGQQEGVVDHGRARRHCAGCGPAPPGRSGRRNSAGGISGPAPDRASAWPRRGRQPERLREPQQPVGRRIRKAPAPRGRAAPECPPRGPPLGRCRRSDRWASSAPKKSKERDRRRRNRRSRESPSQRRLKQDRRKSSML
jgi:hypothetical protein